MPKVLAMASHRKGSKSSKKISAESSLMFSDDPIVEGLR